MNTKSKRKSKIKSNVDVYRRFAEVYDDISADSHSLNMVDYTLRIFRKFRLKPKTGLDLCCGTGSAAIALAELGFSITGVDKSKHMLRYARQKAKSSGLTKLNPNFVNDSLPQLKQTSKESFERYDFVTCFFDSLNYMLTEKELSLAFRAVSDRLRPGGLFIFDLNSAEALKKVWGEDVFGNAFDDSAWITKGVYFARAKMATVRLIMFVRKGSTEIWRRFEESHTEKAYHIIDVKRFLKLAGLIPVASYCCLTFAKAKERDHRICFVARKPE
ncbi:MAG: class I SAM-dependent methyltransferase [candidate division Zixibacteria bacterium]|nr:class I SAM-dependent methyltransferase [candidate division Zixibacteria bacterium]